MRRLVLAGAITCVIVTAVLVIQAMILPQSNVGYVDVGDRDSLPMIRLDVDPTVTAVGHAKLVPGGNFRYAFRVPTPGASRCGISPCAATRSPAGSPSRARDPYRQRSSVQRERSG